MQSTLERAVPVVDVDVFIKRARRIIEKFENNPALAPEAQKESRLLLKQFEKHLEAEGLRC